MPIIYGLKLANNTGTLCPPTGPRLFQQGSQGIRIYNACINCNPIIPPPKGHKHQLPNRHQFLNPKSAIINAPTPVVPGVPFRITQNL